MKATAFAALHPSLKLHPIEIEIKEPGPHEAMIQITHCSVGRGDIGFLENTYQTPDLTYPLVAGHELIGIISKRGTAVTKFKVGDRVGVGYQVWSCGKCDYCLGCHEELCPNQKCLVLHEQGGFASHITVDERFIFKIPEQLDSASATPLLCSGLTTFSAIKKANVKPTMNTGVIGIGGLGHLTIQLLHQRGAVVTAFTSKLDEIDAIKKLGANQVVAYESASLKNGSYDRLFITTPAQITYDYYLQLLKPDGELWVIGSAIQKTQFSSWLLNDFSSRSIRGSYIGSPNEMRELLALAAEHNIHGSVKTVPMKQINEALRTVANGSNDFRTVVTND
jgi:uncharacterized zinc-type alcohol dehydrogenase-like protein